MYHDIDPRITEPTELDTAPADPTHRRATSTPAADGLNTPPLRQLHRFRR